MNVNANGEQASPGPEDEGRASRLIDWVLAAAFDGVGPLSSAHDLAEEYRIDQSYPDTDARAKALIRWETTKNFAGGFLTGLGGLIVLPIAVPAALGASWAIQARMVAAIASLYGHDLREDRVRTLALLAIAGDSAVEVLKRAGVQVGKKLTEKVIHRISGKALIEINKQIGFRLITKAGERGVVNLMKAVPAAGGVVAGGFDAATCRTAGRVAMKLFRPTLGPGPR